MYINKTTSIAGLGSVHTLVGAWQLNIVDVKLFWSLFASFETFWPPPVKKKKITPFLPVFLFLVPGHHILLSFDSVHAISYSCPGYVIIMFCWSFLFPISRWFTLPFTFSIGYIDASNKGIERACSWASCDIHISPFSINLWHFSL